MTAIDPIILLTEVLHDAGFPDVNSDRMEARALSADEYIFLEEQSGTTPHIDLSYRPTVQIVVYSKNGYAASRAISHRIQSALKAARDNSYSNGGIHRVITRMAPYRQDVSGLPYGVGRSVAQYDLILSTREKWS